LQVSTLFLQPSSLVQDGIHRWADGHGGVYGAHWHGQVFSWKV